MTSADKLKKVLDELGFTQDEVETFIPFFANMLSEYVATLTANVIPDKIIKDAEKMFQEDQIIEAEKDIVYEVSFIEQTGKPVQFYVEKYIEDFADNLRKDYLMVKGLLNKAIQSSNGDPEELKKYLAKYEQILMDKKIKEIEIHGGGEGGENE